MQNIRSQKSYSPSFGVSLSNPCLKFRRDDFFIRIKGYGKNDEWCKEVKNTAEDAVSSIRKGLSFDAVLKQITDGIKKANQIPLDIKKRLHTGILRTERSGWQYGSSWNGYKLITRYGKSGAIKYRAYEKRLDETINKPLENPFKDISLTRPQKSNYMGNFLEHGAEDFINNAFSHIEKLYKFIIENFVKKEVTENDIVTFNDTVAQIRWIMAHATPWERGSDAISNVFMKALYKAAGIKTVRPAKGISFDMEAYCTNLEEYKKNFPKYFDEVPKIVE